jgi:HAE1 family hydrophobic/amphiphilic exporter-1
LEQSHSEGGGSAKGRPSSQNARGIGIVTQRPVAVTMFMIALAVFGTVSLGKLPVDLLPEISYPTLTVRTTYSGAAPEDVEDRISVRIQEALSTLPGLVRSTSVSRAEASDVVLDFDWGTVMTFAVQDVRDKLDGVFLPDAADRPLILRYDPNLDPVLRIGLTSTRDLTGDRALIQLRWLAEKRVKRELESLPGVAAVLVRGGLEEEIRIRVDPYKMAAQGLNPQTLADRLSQENLNASGGLIREGSTSYLVRTLNEFQSLEEIGNLAIVRRGAGTIRVQDVATVERTHSEREVVTLIDGGEAVEIAVFREAGANIVDLAERVLEAIQGTEGQQAKAEEITAKLERGERMSLSERDEVDFLGWRLRDDVRFEVLSNQSTFIRDAIADVQSAALLGAILAVIVIWVSLRRVSSTLIIAIAIPISVVVTFVPMYLFGVSLNIMSLGGLALGVGMLVDNAIVVLESITRCREEGDDAVQAAIRGTREVAGAITASTLTTICVFAPIVVVHGIAGRIFGDQAVTVVTSLLVSLLVAVLFIPMLASRPWLAGPDPATDPGDDPAGDTAAPTPLGYARAELHGTVRALRGVFAGIRFTWSEFAPSFLLASLRLVLLGAGIVLRLMAFFGVCLYALARLLLWPLHALFDLSWKTLDWGYPRLLSASLAGWWVVMPFTFLLSFLAWQRVPALGLDLLPEIHQGEFTVYTGLGVGSPLEYTEETMGELDRRVRQVESVGLTALTVGVEQDTLTREIEGNHTARLTIRLSEEALSAAGNGPEAVEKFVRSLGSAEGRTRGLSAAGLEDLVIDEVRKLVSGHPAVRTVDIKRPTPFALDAPVQIEILGYDLVALEEVSREVLDRLAGIPGLTDVRSSVKPGHPEARITFDRDKTLSYGLDLATVSNLVRDQVLGNVGTRFVEGDDRIDVRVMGDEVILSTLDRVLDLVVNPEAETPVPLRAVAEVEIVQGPAEIRRIGNSRAVVVSAASAGLDLGGLADAIETSLADLVPPEDVSVQLGGQKREMDQAQSSMTFALILALFLVYVVMASQFESLVQPLIILVTAPLAGVGVVFALDMLGIPLSVVVFIGLIVLAGIVVNDAIVLVDRINQLRGRGQELKAAIIEAGRTRLRPIYMTTATTVLGLLPLTGWLAGVPFVGALSTGEGAEIRAPMAITVITGLTFATLLTLVVIPTVYFVVHWRPSKPSEPGEPETAV